MNRKGKLILTAILSVVMILSGAFFILLSKDKGGDVETVQALNSKEFTGLDNVSVSAYRAKRGNISLKTYPVKNGDFVMLNNYGKTATDSTRDVVLFSIESINGKSLTVLDVNVTLNGQNIVYNGYSDSDSEDAAAVINKSLNMRLTGIASDLKYQTESLGDVMSAEGYYEFFFRVSIDGGTIYPVETGYFYHFGFYLLNDSSYCEPGQIPTALNVDPDLDVNTSTFYDTQSIFNYNKYDNGNPVYPTIKFDPEKYDLTLARTYRNKVENITTKFEYTDSNYQKVNRVADYGILTFNYDVSNRVVSFKMQRDGGYFIFEEDFNYNNPNATNYNKPLFKDLGVYEIKKQYKLYTSNGFISENKGEDGNIFIQNDLLTIFGYVAHYAEAGSGSAEFNSYTTNEFSEVTYLAKPESGELIFTTAEFDGIVNKNPAVVSTNQAPVWFEYNGVLVEGKYWYADASYSSWLLEGENYMFADGKLNEAKAKDYTKSDYFEQSGYYLVRLKYRMETDIGNYPTIFTQYIAFQLRNVSPTATAQASLNGTFEGEDLVSIDSNAFTSGSVRFAIEEKSTFDSNINLYYTYSENFDNTGVRNSFIPYYLGENNQDYTVFSKAGLYKVEVHFGSGSYSVYSFTIDKQSLTDVISITGVSSYVNSRNEVEFRIDESKNFTDRNYVNEAFTIFANKKKSGAAISATLRTISVDAVEDTTSYINKSLVAVSADSHWMYISYKAHNISSAQSYSFVRTDNSLRITNENNIFTSQKIYIFEFSDKAGYTATYIMFLDFTQSEVIQRQQGADINTIPDSFNVVSDTTEIYWGTHKVIKFDNSGFQDGYRDVLKNYAPNVYVDFDSALNIVIPITNVSIKQEELALGGKEQTHTINTLNFNTRMATVYPNASKVPEQTETMALHDEGIYNFTITDDSGNALVYKLEMNLDKSQLKALVSSVLNVNGNEVENPEYHADNQIREQQATSRYGLFISYIDSAASGDDVFAIESLTYTYYPYDLSIENKNVKDSNYPYAANPTIIDEDILSENKYGTGENQFITNIIKEESLTVESGTIAATAPGKYIITRIYQGSESEIGDSGDKKVRTYVFYVDRNPVIDVPDFTDETKPYIGDGIYFELGSQKIQFNEFYRGIYANEKIANQYDIYNEIQGEIRKDISLVTNLIPVTLYIPANKYNVSNEKALKTFDLTVRISHYDGSNLISDKYYARNSSSSMIQIPDLRLPGYYIIQIYDMAVEPNNQVTPNKDSLGYFAFKIDLEKPEGYFQTAQEEKVNLNKGENPLFDFSITEEGLFAYEFERYPDSDPTASELAYTIYRAEQSGSSSFSPFTELSKREYNPEQTDNTKIYRIELPAFGFSEGVLKTFKYKIVYSFQGVNYEQYSPVMEDFGAFTQLNKTSTKDSVIEFTFTDPVDKYYAKIDISKIVIERYKKAANGVFSKDTSFSLSGEAITNLIETRLVSENRRFYSIRLDASTGLDGFGNEYVYFINLSYYGEASDYENPQDYQNYHSNKQSLLIDRTPPSYFLDQLVKQNQATLTYYGITEPSKLYNYATGDEVSKNQVYYYARVADFDFKIDGSFKFIRKAATEYVSQDQETQYMYIRAYEKYNTNVNEAALAGTYQSLIPGDPAYYDVGYLNLRFSNTDTRTWNRLEFTGQTFAEIVNSKSGYYEIIEVDEAGNHTIYTVKYVSSSEDAIVELNYTEQYGVTANRRTNMDDGDITAINSFAITSICGNMGTQLPDMWFTIRLAGKEYKITPESDLDAIIAEMNSTFVVGHSYPIEITNRFGKAFTCNIRVVNQDLYLDDPVSSDTIGSNDKYKITIPKDTELIELKTMQVYKYNTDFAEWEIMLINEYFEYTTLQGDTFDFLTMSDEFSSTERIIELPKGVYKFRFTDNIRNENNLANKKYYEVSLKVGVNDVLSWIYDKPSYFDASNNNMLTTSSFVTLEYNTAIYDIVAYLDDEVYSVTPKDGEEGDEEDNEISSITFEAPKNVGDINVRSGSSYTYTVKVTDRITGEVRNYSFVIYNIFPAVQVTDSTGNSMIGIIALRHTEGQPVELTSFTSKAVYFVWETGIKYGYEVKLVKYTSNYGSVISTQKITADRVTVSTEGVYALVFTNTFLKSERALCFIIKDSTISMYAVYENVPNQGYRLLSPSSVMIDLDECSHLDDVEAPDWTTLIKNYTGIQKEYPKTLVDGARRFMVKSYFTNYSINIEVEGDKLIKTNYADIISNETDNLVKKQFAIKNVLNADFESYVIVVYGQTPYSYLDVFVITKVASSSNILNSVSYEYKNTEGETEKYSINHAMTDYLQVYVSPFTLSWTAYYGMAQNTISVAYYFNNRYIETTLGTDLGDVRTFTLMTPGEYRFVFTDLAGNSHRFGTSGSNELTILLLSEVVYKINGSDPIYGAVYNETVTLTIEDTTRYSALSVVAYKNGELYEITPVKNVYTFPEVGVYRILLNADVTYGSSRTTLKEAVSMFTIINKNEARFAYEFTDLNGFEIVKVTKGGFLDKESDYIDITEIIKDTNNVVTIYNLVISEEKFGTGKYQIYVEGTNDNILMDGQGFTFSIWINNEVPVITSTIEPGTTTLDEIGVSYNAKSIYEQIGESKIIIYKKIGTTIMGKVEYTGEINERVNLVNNELRITQNGEFYVALVTNAGNVVSMFKVTKEEPLNTVAIIIIVVSVLVVVVGTIVFIKMRLRMAVK